MPLGEKLQRPFELLSLVGRKKKEAAAAPPTASHHHQSSALPHQRAHQHLPAPPQSGGGFYPSNQVSYERLTPSSAASGASQVQYERLTPASASAPLPPQPALITHVPKSKPKPPKPQPLVYDAAARAAAFPSPDATVAPPPPPPATFRSPALSSLPSPGMLTPITPGDVGRSPGLDLPPLVRPSSAAPAPAAAAQVAVTAPSPSRVPPTSGALTPNSVAMVGSQPLPPPGTSSFSSVMGEWMSQLRTPTPDVTLLPSPFDFNQDTPTPLDKAEDLVRLQDALLPTPPPDVHDQKQHPKSSDYVLSASRRPLLEDIASLCRDLNSQDINEPRAPYASASAVGMAKSPAIPSVHQLRGIETKYEAYDPRRPSTRAYVEEDEYDDDEDKMSVSSSTPANSSGGGKGKRRKMCTAEGCTNLSRSRGLCKAHGGGRRCSVDGCTRASQSGSLCITHGGGKRCTVDGCMKAAQSRGMCKAHGGGVRCRVEGCVKSSQGDGFCRSHGGGRRCGHPAGCTKWAQRNGMCMAHSEGKYGNSYRGRLARMQQGHAQPAGGDQWS